MEDHMGRSVAALSHNSHGNTLALPSDDVRGDGQRDRQRRGEGEGTRLSPHGKIRAEHYCAQEPLGRPQRG